MVRRETERPSASSDRELAHGWTPPVIHEETCVEHPYRRSPSIAAGAGRQTHHGTSPARSCATTSPSRWGLLSAVVESADEDFAVTLERTYAAWEQDRPAALADRICRDEVEYVRSYQ